LSLKDNYFFQLFQIGGLMTKKKLNGVSLYLISLMLLIVIFGCQVNQNNSSSGSGSGTPTQDQPAHGQVTYNILEKSPFSSQQLDSSFWTNLEAYCKAGPTLLIIADMDQIPTQMSRAGFIARWAAQDYALATIYAGTGWSADPSDGESQALYDQRDKIDAWWSRYIQRIVQIMEKAPQTTAIILLNDGFDRCGFRLGPAIYQNMGSVASRVQLGDVYEYKTRSIRFPK
jgi:hypothetical protein